MTPEGGPENRERRAREKRSLIYNNLIYSAILKTAESRYGTYRELLKKLKKKPPKGIEERIHLLHHRAFEEIDCLKCGNCCRAVGPKLNNSDTARLAKALSLKKKEIEKLYLAIDEDGDTVFNTRPCPFLQNNNLCLIYEKRPKACREYPHTGGQYSGSIS
ncbi:MAG: YkgJ family cysteine cluster protein, partial [Spirochaetaceae bacterium]